MCQRFDRTQPAGVNGRRPGPQFRPKKPGGSARRVIQPGYLRGAHASKRWNCRIESARVTETGKRSRACLKRVVGGETFPCPVAGHRRMPARFPAPGPVPAAGYPRNRSTHPATTVSKLLIESTRHPSEIAGFHRSPFEGRIVIHPNRSGSSKRRFTPSCLSSNKSATIRAVAGARLRPIMAWPVATRRFFHRRGRPR